MTASAAPGPRPHAMAFIAVTVALDALVVGVILPVAPRLIGALGGGGPARVAAIFGLFATVFAVMQLIAAPILGALSDRFGRRPVILASNLGLGIDFLVMALAPNLAWLFAGRLLSGAASGSGPAAYAYLADVTPAADRPRRFGLLFAAQAAGAALGPALGGALSGWDLRAPFWAAAGLSLANALYGLVVLPESLAASDRAPLKVAHLNPFGGLAWLLRAYPGLALMLAVAFLLSLASQGANAVAVVYAGYRYAWTPRAIGALLSVFAIASLAVQAFLVGPTERALGARRAMLGALCLTVLGLAGFGLAPTGVAFSLCVPLLALGALSGPMMAGYFSGAVRAEEQGRLQGAWASVNSLMGLVAPALFTLVFAAAVGRTPPALIGAPFFLAAGLIALAIALAARAAWPSPGRV